MSSLLTQLLLQHSTHQQKLHDRAEMEHQEKFIKEFIRLFDPTEPMFIRALKSVYTTDTSLEETREIANFFTKKGLIPPRLDEWSIVLGAAATKILVKECYNL